MSPLGYSLYSCSSCSSSSTNCPLSTSEGGEEKPGCAAPTGARGRWRLSRGCERKEPWRSREKLGVRAGLGFMVSMVKFTSCPHPQGTVRVADQAQGGRVVASGHTLPWDGFSSSFILFNFLTIFCSYL